MQQVTATPMLKAAVAICGPLLHLTATLNRAALGTANVGGVLTKNPRRILRREHGGPHFCRTSKEPPIEILSGGIAYRVGNLEIPQVSRTGSERRLRKETIFRRWK